MEKNIPNTFRQFLALLLCAAMLIPMVPVSASATEVTEPVIEVENTTPAQTEPDAAVEETEATVEETEAATEATEAPTETQERLDTMAVETGADQIRISDAISIPAYPGGTVSKTMEYDCGNGVANDGSKSYLTIVTETSAEDFTDYQELLKAGGFARIMDKEITSDDAASPNLFASYQGTASTDAKYKLYIYYFPHYKETRIIVDTNADTVEGFIYEAGETVTTPMLAMWGLSMSETGYDITSKYESYRTGKRNCGALIVIRMPDNSLFIHDGGDIHQWSDEACDAFLAFCRDLTGIPEGQKMVINTYFLSHAHEDHYGGFPRFINKYHDHFDLKNIMYNIDIERTNTTRDIHNHVQLISSFYPNVRYYKPHTGESFTIAGVKFDVMYALEDRYLPNAEGQLITDYPYDVGGTYRDYFYDDPEDPTSLSDFNDTCTVLRVTFDNGVNSILYADANRAEQTMLDIYPDSALKNDIMMIPHHGFDSHPKLCALSEASIFLFTQHKTAIYGPDNDPDTTNPAGIARDDVRMNFVAMRDAVNDTGRVEGEDYKFYWGGNNTVVIDINSMAGTAGSATAIPGMTVDSDAIGSSVVYMDDAMSFEYTGWTIYDLYENALSTGEETTTAAVSTQTTHQIRFDPVTGAPKVGGHYLIRSAEYSQYVMSFGALADKPGTRNKANSLLNNGTPGSSDATNLFFVNDDGYLYLDHSNRDNVIWIADHQNDADEFTAHSKNDFGGTRYLYFSLYKGAYSEAEPYWYAIEGNDVTDPVTQYRYMNLRSVSTPIRNRPLTDIEDHSSYKNRYCIEVFTDGTCFIYYKVSDNAYRVLVCDENGNWKAKLYSNTDASAPSVDQLKEDLEAGKLKFKLYEYKSMSAIKSVKFSGATTFNVKQGTTLEQVLELIQPEITVRDKDRRQFAIPCSGDTPKVGYYYLNLLGVYDPSGQKQQTYTVQVLYRNDDGSDTEVTTLTVNIAKPELALSGTNTYYVAEGVTEMAVREQIVNNITVTNLHQNAAVSYAASPEEGKYWLSFDPIFESVENKNYTVTVNYRHVDGTDTAVGTVSVHVDPVNLTFGEVENKRGLVMVNAGLGTVVKTEAGEDLTIQVNNVDRKVSVGMLSFSADTTITHADGTTVTYKAGAPVDTSKAGVYEGLTLTYGGKVVCNDFILEVSDGDEALDNPPAGQPGYVGVNKVGTTTKEEFSEDGVANIQLSATGIPVEKGIDLIFVMDLSGSMENAMDTNTDPVDGALRRYEAMQESLKSMIQNLHGADVRIAMSDFGDIDHYNLKDSYLDSSIQGKPIFEVTFDNGTYVDDTYDYHNHVNFLFTAQNERHGAYGIVQTKFNKSNPSYTGFVEPMIYTGSHTVNADAFVDVSTLYNGTNFTEEMDEIITNINANVQKSLGTNYDIGLEYAYYLGYAIQQENIANGEDREIICIFMSDGAPMQYNYFSGNPQSQAWTDWVDGTIDEITGKQVITEAIHETGYSDTKQPTTFTAVEAKLLELLKAGTLIRPEYHRDNWTGYVYKTEDAANNKDTNDRVQAYTLANGNFLYNMRYHASVAHQYFYTYMDKQNYDLDWAYLCDIAAANGIENYTYEDFLADPTVAVLMNKLIAHIGNEDKIVAYQRVENTDGTVDVYPVYQTDLVDPGALEEMYYAKASYTGDDFFAAMESIGVACDWDLFAKIAYKNRSSLKDAEGNDLLLAMINQMDTVPEGYTYATHSPYTHFYNADGKNWWAEAIKGDPSQLYPVVNKYAYENCTDMPISYYGDVREDYNGLAHMSGFRGLGIDIYSISFSVADDRLLTADVAQRVLQRISSNAGTTTGNYFFSASSQDELTNALKAIVTTMSTGATRAFFTDTMGDNYDLYTGQVEGVNETPLIRVLEYDLDENGNRMPNPNVRETIQFQDRDGDGDMDAISDQVYTTVTDADGTIRREYPDIWHESGDNAGLIYGKYVIYNTKATSAVLYLDNTGRPFTLKAETFFWTIGNIGKTEMVLEYQVYLTDSMDPDSAFNQSLIGKTEVFDTNKEELLTYVNYLGHLCTKDPESPNYPWGEGPVMSYVFYLVDEQGRPLSVSGQVTDFANRYELTAPKYAPVTDGQSNIYSASQFYQTAGLSDKFELYDKTASYTLNYGLTDNHSWSRTGNTTYVTNYGGAPSNATSSTEAGYNLDGTSTTDGEKIDLNNTRVYFAVKLKSLVNPDTVVVDYALPVNIDVLSNDKLSEGTNVFGIKAGTNRPSNGTTPAEGVFGNSKLGSFGTMTLDNNLLTYTLSSMDMAKEDTFVYAVQDQETQVYYYSTVTVIPATTIYYEDSFVTYSTWSVEDPTKPLTNSWDEDEKDEDEKDEGTKPNQDQDRPGVMDKNDANNIYGFDSAYTNMATYSLGSYNKVTVNADKFAEAQFTFTGTGFDVISLTNSLSGTIMVDVFDADAFETNGYNATPVKSQMVDTFYGYKRVLADILYFYNGAAWERNVQGISKATAEKPASFPEKSESEYGDTVTAVEYDWFVSDTDSDTLYQVPVMKISGLEYGTYTVIIMVAYNEVFDHKGTGSYSFWLDAIRIYDPANDGATSEKVEDAYVSDHEGWPEYFELRNLIISPAKLDNIPDEEQTAGVLFIDNRVNGSNGIEYSIAEYTNYGPNNEVYLAPNQSITFNLSVVGTTVDQIHLGLKSVGGTANVKVYDAANPDVNVLNDKNEAYAIATATDMYYNISALNDKTGNTTKTVVITNTGGAILSITNVKVTYTAKHTDGIEKGYFNVSKQSVKQALKSLRPKVEAPVLAITQQPVDYVGMVGDNASFTVAAQGQGLSYQWYYRDADTGWSKTSNGTEATLNVEFLAYRNGRQFRCEITDLNGGTVTTDTVTLTAQTMDLVITGQPVSASGAVNEEMAFTVEAAGNGLTYQWYYSADNGATWQKSGTPGFNTATLLPILRDYRNGYQYQCRISDVFGNVVTSDAATMTVKTGEVVITAQPADVSTAALNKLYTYQVTATGENLTYRWEYSTDGGATWQLSWNDGYDADTLTVRMYAYRDGYLYRCKVTSGLTNSVYTEPADLKLQAPSVEIVKQPVRVSAVAGETVLFQVEATGSDLTYAWYRSDDQCNTWTRTWLNGCDTDTLSFDATAGRAAHYKCQITDGSGTSVWTNAVKLQVLSAKLQIVSQPENAICSNGATASFKVEAQGDNLKYQWYASADGGETWTKTWLGGCNTDTLSFVVNAGRAAKIYKCVITDAAGNSITSQEVSVYVEA